MRALWLETRRLVLREFEDADHVACHVYESDPVAVRYQSYDVLTLQESLANIRKVRAETQASDPRTLFELAVVTREDGMVIGKCGLSLRRPAHREGELWYAIRRDRWGHGYAVEAATALTDYGFRELGLHRISADTDPRNTASHRVVEKLGMQREGILRENWFLKGEWCDTLLFAILDRDWIRAASPSGGRIESDQGDTLTS